MITVIFYHNNVIPMSQTLDYETLTRKIIEMDENIRFAAVSNMNGAVLSSTSKSNTDLLLSPEDTKETLQHAVSAWKSRMKHYEKIGEGLYTLAVYEKLRRVTIPLPSGNLLLVTIDNSGGQKQIIDRILNLVKFHDYTVA